jgi:AP-4 complex subunit mu-1
VEGVSYLYLKQQALYFVLTTYANVQPSYGLELLARAAQLFKDHCGILSEEALRRNFTLVYEILDELIDFGYPQATSTEQLKGFILTAPVVVEAVGQSLEQRVNNAIERIVAPVQNVTSARSAQRPIAAPEKSSSISSADGVLAAVTGAANRRAELFVDLTERLNVILGASGQVCRFRLRAWGDREEST